MPNFNAVVGIGQTALNAILVEVHTALKPSGIFKISVDINAEGIKNVVVDISQPPQVDYAVSGWSIADGGYAVADCVLNGRLRTII